MREIKRVLLGGSPCTNWSIAQKNNRETEAEGIGWELFKNYVIAKEKFKPDHFIYENNKSASQPIKDQIAYELGVGQDNGVRFTYINSALVSAQNRQRFYVTNTGDMPQPEDMGIVLKDILESGIQLDEKSYCLTASYNGAVIWNTLERKQRSMIAEPVRIGDIGSTSQAHRVYAPQGKSVTISTGSMVTSSCATLVFELITKANGEMYIEANGKTINIYKVENGNITIKGKQYPIKLSDGYYIIRKLTVKECMRLQTVPEWYEFKCSNSQAYKMLGNGWTVNVIKHLLEQIPNYKDYDWEVLSMYDGMSCGQIALKELGFNVIKYKSYEIDKYAVETTQHNFPNTVQCGDAFKLRETDWGF